MKGLQKDRLVKSAQILLATSKFSCFFFCFSVKNLKQRLDDSSENTKLDPDTISVDKNPPTVKCQKQSFPSESSVWSGASAKQAATAESTVSESAAAGSSATATNDIAMREDGETLKTECNTESKVASKANETGKGEEGSPATPVATAKETVAELPKIDEDIFNILTAAVRQHRLTRETRTQSSEKEVTLGFNFHLALALGK